MSKLWWSFVDLWPNTIRSLVARLLMRWIERLALGAKVRAVDSEEG